MSNISNEDIKDQIRILEETTVPGQSDAFALWALRELLALREAGKEPVAWDYEWASCITCDGPQNFKRVIEREAPPEWAIDESQARNIIPLYAAPPLVDGTIEMLAKVLANAPLAPSDSQGKKRS